MVRFFYKFLCIISILSLLGCELTRETKQEVKKQTAGTTLGFTDETTVTKLNTTFKIPSNTVFSPEIYLHNRDTKENIYRLFFILDYKQINVNFNKKSIRYLDIVSKPNEEIRFTIDIPYIKEGLHDFIIMSVRNPDKLLEEKQFIPSGRFYMFKRTNLIVGNNNRFPPIRYKDFEVISGDEYIPPIITEQPRNKLSGEVVTTLKEDEYKNPLWLNFSTRKTNMRFSILVFLGNEQVNLEDSFVQISSTGVVNIPLNLDLTKKHNNLIVALVENPFKIIETNEGKFIKEPWFVNFVNRISIK